MRLKHKRLLLALVFPFIALVALTGFKAAKRYMGTELTIPVVGYDPRDILSGHYLIYRLDFAEEICPAERQDADRVYLCVVQKKKKVTAQEIFTADPLVHRGCTAVLKGRCQGGRFLAGVERFYIPEQHAQLLDRIVRRWGDEGGRTRLVIAVDYQGKAVVKELLIDDKPLREFLSQVKRGGKTN